MKMFAICFLNRLFSHGWVYIPYLRVSQFREGVVFQVLYVQMYGDFLFQTLSTRHSLLRAQLSWLNFHVSLCVWGAAGSWSAHRFLPTDTTRHRQTALDLRADSRACPSRRSTSPLRIRRRRRCCHCCDYPERSLWSDVFTPGSSFRRPILTLALSGFRDGWPLHNRF